MAIYERGYRGFEGSAGRRFLRWWPITIANLRTTKRGLLIVACIPGIIALIVKLTEAWFIGFVETGGGAMFDMDELPFHFDDGFFFQTVSWQSLWVIPLLLVVGSGQIAEDFRTGALQLYFSKPITQRDYVMGKLGAVLLASFLLTLVPGILVLLSAAAFAPDWTWLSDNPWLPAKTLGFGLLASLVLGGLVLGLSSLGQRGWLVGLLFAGAYLFTSTVGQVLPRILEDQRWEVVHLGRCIDIAGGSLFTAGPSFDGSPLAAWIILGGIFVGSLLLLVRKVRTVEVVT